MKIQIRNTLAVIVSILVIVLASTTYYTPPRSDSEEILTQAMEIAKEITEIRNLTFRREPQFIVVDIEWATKRTSSRANRELETWEEIYKLTMLVPQDYDIVRAATQYRASWIAATMGNKIYIIEENFKDSGDTAYRVIAHELIHVLQKEYFDPPTPKILDERLAVSALIEGDADLVADEYSKRHNLRVFKTTKLPLYDPHIALRSFPYVYGEKFVKFLYDQGGWELVNKAYKNLPSSTEQIMHPQKYLKGEAPKKVEISLDKNYKLIHEDRLGEFYVYVLVATKLGIENASKVAEGWDGDKVVLLANNTHEILLWKTLWETPSDAQEFYEALIQIAEMQGVKDGENYKVGDMIVRIKMKGNEVELKAIKSLN